MKAPVGARRPQEPNRMCIICLEFQRNKDLNDARRMLASARREPTAIPEAHLDQVERELQKAEDEAP
jgi:hypothetical protein